MSRKLLVSLLVVSWSAQFISASNQLGGFAQIAVGDEIESVVDLTNQGTATFFGFFHVLDDSGLDLPVRIDGVLTSDFFSFEIPAGSTIRYTVSRSGQAVSGHLLIWDRLPEGTVNLDTQISGTLTYRFLDGATLTDSIGVPMSDFVEHFFFLAERTSTARSGLAVSNPSDETVTITLRGISASAQLVDIGILQLGPFGHRAFFADEALSLPATFRGVVQVESDRRVLAVALKQDGLQLSTIGVTPVRSNYDISIFLNDGRQFTGQMSFFIWNATITGLVKITELQVEGGLAVLTGFAFEGLVLGTILGSANNRLIAITIGSLSMRTSDSSITAEVFWDDELSESNGTLLGTRRD